MKTIRIQVCRSLLALGLFATACDADEPVTDEDAAAEAEDADDAEIAERLFCYYPSAPPATDDSDSIIGATDDVESEDAANGACDLHMFRVTANPPADRARTVTFEASSNQPFDDYGARVWTKSCAGGLGGTCAATFSSTSVDLEMTGGCVQGCSYCPVKCAYSVTGTYELSANNSVADLRAGMRATDADGDPVLVHVSVSE